MKSFFTRLVSACALWALSSAVPLPAADLPVSSGLVLRLEAGNGVTAVDGRVQTWADLSGRGNDVAARGEPRLVAGATPAGGSAVELDGVDDALVREHLTQLLNGFPVGDAPRTLVVVARYGSGAAAAGVLYGTPQANRIFGVGVRPSVGDLMLQVHHASNLNVYSNVAAIDRWLVQTGVIGSTGAVLALDGAKVGEGKANLNTSLTRLAIGETLARGEFVPMQVACVLLYDRELTVEEWTALHAHLGEHYLTPPPNQAPVVTILEPPDNTPVTAGAPLTFTAAAIDPEDGDLSHAIVWHSDVDAELGYGAALTIPDLSVGEHLVTASVADSAGAISIDSVAVAVVPPSNTAPAVSLASLPSTLEFGETVTHLVIGSDVDGDLQHLQLEASAPIGGVWGTVREWTFAPTNSATRSHENVPLDVGTWRLRAGATDATGASDYSAVNEVQVLRAVPAGSFADRQAAATSDVGYQVVGGDLNAIFRNRHSPLVPGPGGAITYSRAILTEGTAARRINVGGELHVDESGQTWSADSSLAGTRLTTTGEIAGTTEPLLYQSAREGPETEPLVYRFAVAPGAYLVRLHWAEIAATVATAGERVFEVRLQGRQMHAGVDPIALAGERFRAVQLAWAVTVSGPELALELVPVVGRTALNALEVIALEAGAPAAIAAGEWLGVGYHQVVAHVAPDSFYEAASVSAVFSVTAAVVNAPPVVRLVAPAESAAFLVGEVIAFRATAEDAEDGVLTDYVTWSSDRDGPLGSGGTVSVGTLSEGEHLITAAVADSDGVTGTASVIVRILPPPPPNTPPAIEILAPSPDGEYVAGEVIGFHAHPSDQEDEAEALNAAVVWSSDRDGVLGIGATLAAVLTEGDHVIGVRVSDSGGLEATAERSLRVVAAGSLPRSGLVLHLDAADIPVGPEAGTLVWPDRSGNGNDLTAEGAATVLPAVTPAGGPAVALDGANAAFARRLPGQVINGLPAANEDRTVVMVARYHDVSATAGLVYGRAESPNSFGVVVDAASSAYAVPADATGLPLLSEVNAVGAGWAIQVATMRGGIGTLHVNGALVASGARMFASEVQAIVLGEALDGNGGAALEVMAALAYDRALSEEERTRLESALHAQLAAYEDSDGDGLPDPWEEAHIGGLLEGPDGDRDADGLTNGEEYARGLDPQNDDSDGDGQPDGWELAYQLKPYVRDGAGDADADGATNYDEYRWGRNPRAGVDPDASAALRLHVFQPLE